MNPYRPVLLAVALVSMILLAVALYLQHAKDMPPCPLCVIQRYAFLFAGVFSLLAAWGSAQSKPAKVWNVLALICALTGLGYAAHHLYVQANPGFSCGIDPMETFLNKIPTATAMPWLFQADGLCTQPDFWLGLSIPTWSALGFALVVIVLAFTLLRRR